MAKAKQNNNQFEDVACNICGSKEFDIVYDQLTYWEYKGSFREVQCQSCKLVFLNPRPKLQYISKYYEIDNYFGRDISTKTAEIDDATIRWEAYSPSYKEVLRRFKKGKILDIGAGTGLYLSFFKEKGWDVSGIELTDDAVSYAKKQYGITLKKGDFFDFEFPKNSFDVVSLNGALEHMYHPVETLTKARSYLKKGGIVIISIPNVDGLGRYIFGRNWFPWQPPRHLYLFSPDTVTKAFKKAGYSSVTIDHNYYVQNQYILFNSLRYSKSPKFQKKETGGLVDRQSNKRSSSVVVQGGKVLWDGISRVLAHLEPLIKHGEVILVTAEK